MHVLVTGASGFIGRHLVRSIRNHRVTAIGRTHVDEVDRFISVDVDSDTDYTGLLDKNGETASFTVQPLLVALELTRVCS